MKRKLALFLLLIIMILFFVPTIQAASTFVDPTIKIYIDDKLAGKTTTIMHEYSIYVPLRFISQELGASVKWQGETRSVYIDKVAGNATTPNYSPQSNQNDIAISGGDNFKSAINEALIMLKTKTPNVYNMIKNNINRINDAKIQNSNMLANVNQTVCNIDWQKFNAWAERNKVQGKEKLAFLASILAHEAYHVDLFKRGFYTSSYRLSMLEIEVLTHTLQRQVLSKLGASTRLINHISVDKVIDTNYMGIFN